MRATCVGLVVLLAVAMVGCANRRQEEERLPQLESSELAYEEPAPRRPTVIEEPPVTPPPPPPPPPEPAGMTGQTYTVQRGDTLYSIARRFYGDGKLWTRIDAANRGKYKSHTDIPVGTVLVVPPK